MTDIVERLSFIADALKLSKTIPADLAPATIREGISEIEQLRKQVDLLKSNLSIIEDNAHHCLMLVGGSLD